MQNVSIDPADRMSKMRPLQLYGQGKGPLPMFSESEEFENLEFEKLWENYRKADAASAKSPSNTALRIQLIYAFAMVRDAQYSYAGRRFMQALALNNDFRGLYEGAKAAVDAGL